MPLAAASLDLDFPLNKLRHASPQIQRSYQQLVEVSLPRISSQVIEQTRRVLSDLFVGGKHTEIRIKPRGYSVVIASPEVAIPANRVTFAADDQSDLGVYL